MISKEVSAVVVARKGSIRVKNKSMQKIGGKTLIENKIQQLKSSRNIDRVIFGSDSDLMLEHALQAGAEVIKRPEFYCDEKLASANDMIANMMSLIKTDVVVWAHATNPFISSKTYDLAVECFLNNAEYDSLLSVVKLQEHLWCENKKPLNYNPYAKKHVPARDLPSYYMQDGGIFIQHYKNMKENSYFFGEKPFLFETPIDEFMDIDTEMDLAIARAMYSFFNKS